MDSEQLITELLQRMSLAQKVGQCCQFPLMGDEDQLGELLVNAKAGSVVLAYTPLAGCEDPAREQRELRCRLQERYLSESQSDIALLLGRDVIHGHSTVFPIPLGQAASFDLPLVKEAAKIAAIEAAADGVRWTFAPMLDIARDPRWGRVIEGCGEDQYLACCMACAMVEGYHEPTVGAYRLFACCAKHFVAYGASEGGRDYSGADVSPVQLYNTYLPPFRTAVDAGVDTVMASFNDINSEPVTGSYRYITQLLKEKLGFEGFVVSDWDAIGQLVQQGVAADRREAAKMAFLAGIDMDMCSGCYSQYLQELVESGECPIERLDDAVRRILRVKAKLGLLSGQDKGTQGLSYERVSAQQSAEYRACALRLAEESIVLLKNRDNILPLKKGMRLMITGAFANEQRSLLGSWTLDGQAEQVVSVAKALLNNSEFVFVKRPEEADAVIAVLGEEWQNTGEAAGSCTISLPEEQDAMIRELSQKNNKLIALVAAGRPMDLSRIEPCVKSIVYLWHGGTEAGNAAANILTGQAMPSGKLPITLPRSVGQIPIYYGQRPGARSISEYYGAVSFKNYNDGEGSPLYPFGYGLTYTQFELSDPQTDRNETDIGGYIIVSVNIRNVGGCEGTQVVQCYIEGGGTVVRPMRRLCAFARVQLCCGEERRINFTLCARDFLYFDGNGEPLPISGNYKIYTGTDSTATRSVSVRIL